MDTRDTGLSTHLTQYDVPRRQRPPLYSLRDLTEDVIAVFDALGWHAAHLLGASEGGMIAQATATHHPTRVRSLTSALATPTTSLLVNRPKILPNLKALRAMHRTSKDRDAEGHACGHRPVITAKSMAAALTRPPALPGRCGYDTMQAELTR
ncbi:MAG: alpha/beta fold hydrolase [Sciscionella sp.]